MSIFKYKSRAGQSLVGVLMASAVGAIVLGFLTDTMVQQGISQKFLAQKLEMNDFKNNLITTFSKGDNCTCQFENNAATNPNHGNYGSLTFDATQAPRTQKLIIRSLYSGCKTPANPAFTPPVLVREGVALPSSSTNLIVANVELIELEQAGAVNTEWQGKWSISFQTGTGGVIRSVKPVTVVQKVTIDNPLSATARVIACKGISTGSGTENFLAKWSSTLGQLVNTGVFEEPSGHVGIGTIDPRDKLEVNGAINSTTQATFNTPSAARLDYCLNCGTSAGPASRISAIGAAPGALGEFRLDLYSSDASLSRIPLFINSAGNIGVSTTTPLARFHVNGSSMRIDRDTITNGSGPALEFYNTTTPIGEVVYVLDGVDGSALNFYTKTSGGDLGAPKVRIDNSGNVGFGTVAPQSQLHVTAARPALTLTDTTVAGNTLLMQAGGAGVGPIIAGHTNAAGEATVNTNSSRIQLGNGGFNVEHSSSTAVGSARSWTSRIFINGSGDVGIGKTNPGTKLDVNGGIKPGSARVNTSCAGNSEGTFAYDPTLHAPVFCGVSGNWTAFGATSSVPSGTICGTANSYSDIACNGVSPASGCPSGYVQSNTGHVYLGVICVKN